MAAKSTMNGSNTSNLTNGRNGLYYIDLGRLTISLAIVVAIVETTVGAIVVILATLVTLATVLATVATLAKVLATVATLAMLVKSARKGRNISNGTNGRNIVNGRNTSNGINTDNNIIGRINSSGSIDSKGTNSRKDDKGPTISAISFGSRACKRNWNF